MGIQYQLLISYQRLVKCDTEVASLGYLYVLMTLPWQCNMVCLPPKLSAKSREG